MLYTLLVAERYHQEVDAGLLFYTQKEEVVRVPVVRNELRGLVMARNDLAGYMVRKHQLGEGRRNTDGVSVEGDEPFLPPSVDDERVCKRCYVVDTCMLYRRVCCILFIISPIFLTRVFIGCRECAGYVLAHCGYL